MSGWITNPPELEKLLKYQDDKKFKIKYQAMKQARKVALAERIEKESGIKLNPNSIFDIHVKDYMNTNVNY